jgi:hypothetical protein
VPEITGAEVFSGAPSTLLEAAEVADDDPATLLAVTVILNVLPLSALVRL